MPYTQQFGSTPLKPVHASEIIKSKSETLQIRKGGALYTIKK